MKNPSQKIFRPDFLQIPFQLIDDRELEQNDRLVYGLVYWFEHLKDGSCTAGNNTIAELLHTTTRVVQNSLNALEERGYIKRIYKDDSKRNRLMIQSKIAYKNVSPMGDRHPASVLQVTNVRPIGDTHVRPIGDQNKNIVNKNSNIAAASAAEVFSFKDEIKKMEDHKRRDINIIGFYFEIKKPDIKNREQLHIAIKRHLRAANDLIPFTDSQLVAASKKAEKLTSEWTLETLVKILTK